jgi:hypothetical protein
MNRLGRSRFNGESTKTRVVLVCIALAIVAAVFGGRGREDALAEATTMRLGFIGEETSAQVDFDLRRELAILTGGRLGDAQLVLDGDRVLVRGSVIGLELPNEGWVSLPATLTLGASFPGTFDGLVSAITRGTKQCPTTGVETLAVLRLLFGRDVGTVSPFALCGAGINGGGFANGENIRVLAEDVSRNEATRFDLATATRAESVGDVLALSATLETLLNQP